VRALERYKLSFASKIKSESSQTYFDFDRDVFFLDKGPDKSNMSNFYPVFLKFVSDMEDVQKIKFLTTYLRDGFTLGGYLTKDYENSLKGLQLFIVGILLGRSNDLRFEDLVISRLHSSYYSVEKTIAPVTLGWLENVSPADGTIHEISHLPPPQRIGKCSSWERRGNF
jgi:hypothetical protein